MLTKDVLKKHDKLCNEILEEMTDYVTSGKCADFSEYKLLVGKIRGMHMSREVLDESKRSIEEDDDE